MRKENDNKNRGREGRGDQKSTNQSISLNELAEGIDIQNDSDEILVQHSKEGDLTSFEELISRYEEKLYHMIFNKTGHEEDARDLLQETLVKAYESIHTFQGKSTFYTWIYKIAKNKTINHLKKKKRRAGYSYDDADSGVLSDPGFVDTAFKSNPRRFSNINELHGQLNHAILKLSDDHRAVVKMFDIQGMHHAQIAKVLNVSVGTVRSRLHYAHQQLQGDLKDFEGGAEKFD